MWLVILLIYIIAFQHNTLIYKQCSRRKTMDPPKLQSLTIFRQQQSESQHSSCSQINPLGKLEARITKDRNMKRKSKVQQRRQARQAQQSAEILCQAQNGQPALESLDSKEIVVDLILSNIRGINDLGKQKELKALLDENKKLQVVMLTETKLSKPLKIEEWRELQSTFYRAGGCWSAIRSNESVKKIKYFDTTLTWISATFNFVPIHILTIYMPPQNNFQAQKTIGNLQHVLSLILDRLPNSKVILGGDFSEYRAKVEAIAKSRGLNTVISEGTPTHEKGNHLDQVMTNLRIEAFELCSVPYSDHQVVHAKLTATKTSNDVDVRAMPRMATMQQFKQIAKCAKTIEKFKSDNWNIEIPAIQLFAEEIQTKPVIRSWYQPRGKWNKEKLQHSLSPSQDDWQQRLQQLKRLHSAGDMKGFFDLVKCLTKIKPKQPVVKGIMQTDGSAIFQPSEINKQIAAHYQKGDLNASQVLGNQNISNLHLEERFTCLEIEVAIAQCDFRKALGPDYFDGTTLANDQVLREKVIKQLLEALNGGNLPKYFCEGRLVPLSKHQGQDCVPLDAIRPIVVRSHLCKIIEKVILNRVMNKGFHLIQTGSYQEGFKAGRSTSIHLASLLLNLKQRQRKQSDRKNILLIDLTSAYNNISRIKLKECLLNRAKSDDDRFLVELILQLHMNQITIIGAERFDAGCGVAQGSVLSPLLFNLVLDEALTSSKMIKALIQRGDIRAFADDLQVQSSSIAELQMFLDEIDKLSTE